MVSVENVTDAIKSLARGSTPGVDDMGLEFFLEHVHEVAPLLSKLFMDVLTRGRMTPSIAKKKSYGQRRSERAEALSCHCAFRSDAPCWSNIFVRC